MLFLSIIPFLVVLVCIALFHHVIIAIAAGIISILTVRTLVLHQPFQIVTSDFLSIMKSVLTGRDYLLPLIFFILLTLIIELLRISGVMDRYRLWIEKKITSRSILEKTTLFLSPLFFIDDYLSALSLGAFVRPVLACHKAAAAKLAYLIDSSTSSLCVLIPISSWGIMIIGQLQAIFSYSDFDTMHTSATQLLFRAVPLLMYPACIYFFAWYVVHSHTSFGLMKAHEESAHREQKNHCLETTPDNKGRRLLFFLPFIVFFGYVAAKMAIAYHASMNKSIFSVLERLDLSFMMTQAIALGFLSLLISMLLLGMLNTTLIKKTMHSTAFNTHGPITVLVLAWIFGGLLKTLGTLDALTSLCATCSTPLWYPLLFFGLSFASGTVMGSSWGGMALLFPLLQSITGSTDTIFCLSFASIISGTIAGTHFSPISDTMIMAATSAGCSVPDHFKTHIQYALFPLIGSVLGLTIASFCSPYVSYGALAVLSIPISFGCTIASSVILKKHAISFKQN